MDHISTLLPKTLRKHGLKDEADASLVVHHAQEWLEEHGTMDAKVMKLEQANLIIEVASSIAAQEVHAKSDELLASLQEK